MAVTHDLNTSGAVIEIRLFPSDHGVINYGLAASAAALAVTATDLSGLTVTAANAAAGFLVPTEHEDNEIVSVWDLVQTGNNIYRRP